MRIDRVRIKNFKCFEDKTFELNSRMTVFIGDNAKGKTSVLQAVSVAAGAFMLGMEGVYTRTIKPNEIRVKTIDGQPKPQKPVQIQGWWNLTTEDRRNWNFPDNQKFLVWTRELKNMRTGSGSARNMEDFARSLLNKSREQSGVIFPIILYFGTGRLWSSHEKLAYQEQKEGVGMAYANSLSDKGTAKEFLEWFKTQEDTVAKFNRQLDVAQLKAFKEVIIGLMPDDRIESFAFDRKSNELIATFKGNSEPGEELLFSQLSDGFRNMMYIAGDIAYRCIQLNPHLGEFVITETPGIVMIDELDMHLHPNWQRRIVDDLKRLFPKIQFVATTHSPFIVQSLKSEELVILDEELTEASDPFRKPLEEVAANDMGVNDMPRSERFLEMQGAAEKYYSLIYAGKNSSNSEDVRRLRSQLDELELYFSEDPAFVASLRIERQVNKL